MSVTLKSGVTTDIATVDVTSKALRVTQYDTTGAVITPLASGGSVIATPVPSATDTNTTVAASAASVAILAANAARLGASVFNDSTVILYLRLNAGAASTSTYNVQVAPGFYYEFPFRYVGAATGIWASATGNARVAEFTA